LKKSQEVVADPYSEAMSIALYALAPRAKSRDELCKQLVKRGVDGDIANSVLDSLELQGGFLGCLLEKVMAMEFVAKLCGS